MTLGQAVAALSPSITIAMLVNPFLIVIFSLYCGVTVPKPQLPGWTRNWLYEIGELSLHRGCGTS